MKKKISITAVVFILVLAISMPIFASTESFSTIADISVEKQVASLTSEVLRTMEPEKELYGLEDIDFSTLYLGSQIPAYELDESGINAITDVFYFPVFSGDTWVATSFVTYGDRGEMIVQISTEYAEKYAELEQLDDEVALIFDESSAYIYTNNTAIITATSSDRISHRINIKDIKESGITINPMTTLLAKKTTIPIKKNAYVTRSAFDNQKYLSVPLIKQAANSLQCWAACIASIRGYYGKSTTIDQVYNFADVTKYKGATLAKCKSVLQKYGFKVTEYSQSFFNWYQLRTEIYTYENPIFAECKYNNSLGHAVVVRGYYVNSQASGIGIISYMDPSTGKYGASSVEKDYGFYYVSSANSKKYSMDCFLSVSK